LIGDVPMETEPTETRHTLTLTSIKDPANRMNVAQALSRMGGLPLDRVIQRLDRLPWTLTRQAPRIKAVRLVQALESLTAEITADPPLLTPQPGGIPDTPGPGIVRESGHATKSWAASQGEPAHQEHEGVPAPAPAAVVPKPEETEPEPDIHVGMIPLEGVLDPAFRIEPSGSRSQAAVRVPWLVLGGTLRSLAPILNRSSDMYRAHFWKFLGITGIPWLVTAAAVLLGAGAVSLASNFWNSLAQLPIWLAVIAMVTLVPLVVVAVVILYTLPHVAMICAVSQIHLGKDILIGQAYRAALPKLGGYLLTQFLLLLVMTGLMMVSGLAAGLIALVMGLGIAVTRSGGASFSIVLLTVFVIGVFLAPLAYCIPRLLLVDKVVILENCSGVEALKRSWRLMSGRALHRWYTSYYWIFGILLVLFIPLQWAIQILFQGPAWLLAYVLPGSKWLGTYASQIMSYLGGLLAGVFVSASLVLFYYSIRNRREGLDLMLQAGIPDSLAPPDA
jgi:hypothetical protein